MEDIYFDKTDEQLLEILIRLVEFDHYDPVETPEDVVAYRKNGYSQYSAKKEILRRLEKC